MKLSQLPLKSNSFLKPTLISLVIAQAMSAQTTQAANIETGPNCTLAQAIVSANKDSVALGSLCVAGSGVDQINLNSDVMLTSIDHQFSGLPAITSAITLNGNNHKIERAANAPAFRILRIATDEDVVLNDVTIRNGLLELDEQDGAGIFVKTVNTLTMNNVSLLNNMAQNNGGGLFTKEVRIQGADGIIVNNSTISDNVVVSGHGGGIGMLDDATNDGFGVVINNTQISNNIAVVGGGISARINTDYYNSGDVNTISIINSSIDRNFALKGNGGGISTEKKLVIQNTSITNNKAGRDGGGIHSRNVSVGSAPYDSVFSPSSVEIRDSTISNNTAHSGGGINTYTSDFYTAGGGTLSIVNSVLSNNVATTTQSVSTQRKSKGGAIESVGDSLLIENSMLLNNVSEGDGGVLWLFSDKIQDLALIKNSVLSDNHTGGSGGVLKLFSGSATFVNVDASNNSAGESGGAFEVQGRLQVKESLISNNSASMNGGAISGEDFYFSYGGSRYGISGALIEVTNTTLSYNSAVVQGGAVNVQGFSTAATSLSTLKLKNATVVGNSAPQGGGVFNRSKLNLENTIVAGNVGAIGSDIYIDPDTEIGLMTNNLFGSMNISTAQSLFNIMPSTTNITATSDGTSPTPLESIIAPLADNGGDTQTHALVDGSPALDVGDVSVCNNLLVKGVDQRGETRGIDECDIGAFELTSTDSLGFTTSVTEAVEGEDQFIILTVTLDQAQDTPVNIDFATQDGSAIAGSDYVERVNSIYFQPGQLSKRRWFKVLDDNEVEGDETFTIQLSPSSEPNNSMSVTAAIADNDAPFTVEVTRNTEGENLIATVTLTQPFDTDYNIDFVTVDGTAIGGVDYVSRFNSIYFKAGETSKRRWFQLLSDNLTEGDETFDIRFSSVADPAIEVVTTATIKDAN